MLAIAAVGVLLVWSKDAGGVTVERTIQCEAPTPSPSVSGDVFAGIADSPCNHKLIATVKSACEAPGVSAVRVTTETEMRGFLSMSATSAYPCSLDLEALTRRLAAS